jgi:hypothetical protein
MALPSRRTAPSELLNLRRVFQFGQCHKADGNGPADHRALFSFAPAWQFQDIFPRTRFSYDSQVASFTLIRFLSTTPE